MINQSQGLNLGVKLSRSGLPARDVLMHFTLFDQGTERTITLQVPSIGWGEDRPEMPEAVWGLICLFADLYDRVKTATPSPEQLWMQVTA
jgi:hypothetical protein